MGVFISVEIEAQALTPEESAALVRLCPVDIYALANDRLIARPDQEDECTLCGLCLLHAPAGAIRILKHYNDEILVSTGTGEAAE